MEATTSMVIEAAASDEEAYTWLESIRWPNGPVCPHCGVVGHAYHLEPKNGARITSTGKATYRKVWKCGDCRKQFTVTVGTCMQGSHISVRRWVLAFHLVSAAKNGMSSHELGRQLEVSHESAWFMSQRIRCAFAPASSAHQEPLTGTVEADEPCIGGHRKHIPGVSDHALKMTVVTPIERDGDARSVVMPVVTAKYVKVFLTGNITPESHLMTNESNMCVGVGRQFASHETVDHGREEYVRGNVHVNTPEGFFSQFKRSLDATHHHVSPKHLRRFAAEFDSRYNTRKVEEGERTVRAVQKSAGKRLMYKEAVRHGPTSS